MDLNDTMTTNADTDVHRTNRPSEGPIARIRIFRDVENERQCQDERWGGPPTDDTRSFDDWLEFIRHQVFRARAETVDQNGVDAVSGGYLKPDRVRARLVKIAALAVAAAEAIDRKGLV